MRRGILFVSLIFQSTLKENSFVYSNLRDFQKLIFFILPDRLANSSPKNASPRSSIRSTKTAMPSSNGVIIDALNVSPKAKVKELESSNRPKTFNKNSANVSKIQKEQMLQEIIDQQTVEEQKRMMELLHANKNIEALGVLVQHLVFNVSIMCQKIF